MWTQSLAEAPNGRRCTVLCRVLQGAKGGVEDFRGRGACRPPRTQAGEAAGGPCPQTLFHPLCFHTGPPSSQFWEWALRAPSDPPPPGSAFVAAHPSLSSSFSSVSLPSSPSLSLPLFFKFYFSECLFHFFFFCESPVSVSVLVLCVHVGNLITFI